MKTMIMIIAFVVFSALAYTRRREQRQAYRAVAEELGLAIDGHRFRGTLNGYEIATDKIRRRQSRYSSVGSKVLETSLRTAPRDLRLDRETIASTIARVAGVRDIEMHDKEFDGVFRIACQHEADTRSWLSSSARQATLLELNRLVDALEIVDGQLRVEIPTDPVEADKVRHLLQWFVDVARRLDEPPATGTPFPPLELTLRERRTKWGPALSFALVMLPLVIGGGMFVYLFWSMGVFKKREPREHIGVWTDGRGMSVPRKDAFIACVKNTPMSPDVDFTECERLGLEVNLAFSEVRDAYITMRTMQARRAARVELDRTGATEFLDTAIRETEGSSGHARMVKEVVQPWYGTLGLHHRYDTLLAEERDRHLDPLPGATSYTLLHEGDVSHARDHSNSTYVAAMRCLTHGDPSFLGFSRSPELNDACRKYESYTWRSGRVAGPEVLAALDRAPLAAIDGILRFEGGRLPAEVELAWFVHRQTPAGADHDRAVVPPAELAAQLPPLQCTTPWTAPEAFGDPEQLSAAADAAGPLADRLRLYAARQWALLGAPPKARQALGAIAGTGIEAVCAAQLESGLGAPADALKRLAAVAEPHGGLRELARAQAHALRGDWKAAYDAGHAALAEVPDELRPHAAMVVIAAAAKLQRDDGLDELYGPVPERSGLREDPIDVTRWLAHVSHDDRRNESDRWIAPDDMRLLIGSEPLQFVAAQELAASKDAELWLDILLPDEFEVLGAAMGRRVAAQLRGDEAAATAWASLEQMHLGAVKDPAKARIYRIARRFDGLR